MVYSNVTNGTVIGAVPDGVPVANDAVTATLGNFYPSELSSVSASSGRPQMTTRNKHRPSTQTQRHRHRHRHTTQTQTDTDTDIDTDSDTDTDNTYTETQLEQLAH